jgi:hypothetical protein
MGMGWAKGKAKDKGFICKGERGGEWDLTKFKLLKSTK